jgi:hypothetical protein
MALPRLAANALQVNRKHGRPAHEYAPTATGCPAAILHFAFCILHDGLSGCYFAFCILHFAFCIRR